MATPTIATEPRQFDLYFEKGSKLLNCLEPMLRILGWSGSPRAIIESFPHFSEKLTINDFRNIMREFHYNSHYLKVSLHQIDTRILPGLFVADNGDVLIIKSITEGIAEVFDGADNQDKSMAVSAIKGKLFIFKAQSEADANQTKSAKIIWQQLSMNKKLVKHILWLGLMINLLSLATPLFVMGVYDKVVSAGSVSMLGEFIIGIVIALCGIVCFQLVRARFVAHICATLDTVIGNKVFGQVINLEARKTESASLGAQVSRIKEFDNVREFFTGPLINVLIDLPFTVIFLITIWCLAGAIILIPLTVALLAAGLAYFVQPKIVSTIKRAAKSNLKRQEFIVESLHQIEQIKLSGAEHLWLDRYRHYSASAALDNFKASIVNAMTTSIADSIMMLTGLLTIAVGVVDVIAGSLTVGALIAIMMLVWKILSPVKTIISNLPRLDQVHNSLKQVIALLNMQTEYEDSKHRINSTYLQGKIEFHRISLRYHSQMDPTLLGIQFRLQPGEFAVIMGHNGSGKTSIFKLLTRLYSPVSGSIRLDGKDIRQIDCQELRQSIGYVTQQPQFFYGTINQNMRLANPLATDEDIRDACEKASVYQEIMQLPEGLETRLRDNYRSKYSSSFVQRLAIARALVKKPKILLLDEPLKNCDFETEKFILKSLQQLKSQLTILMVSHRPSHMDIADRLLVLYHGQLRFNGTPDEFKRRQGQ